jgi:SAM-dependent methyltransferase
MKNVVDLYINNIWVWETVNSVRVQSEVSFILALLSRLFDKGASILDLGCGFGYHLSELSKSYNVTGIDNNKTIVSCARKINPLTRILYGDMRQLKFFEEFDAIICLQSVLSYCLEPQELIDALTGIKLGLKKGGVVVIDVLDILSLLSARKYKSKIRANWKSDNGDVNLYCEHTIDTKLQAMISKRYWTIDGNDHIYYDGTTARLFFPQELITIMICMGFSVLEIPRDINYPCEDRLYLIAQKPYS